MWIWLQEDEKLVGISNTIDLSALSFDDLRDVAKDFKLELKFDEEARKIFIEKKQEVWTFLKLIGDDLLKSPLTKNKYEAQYKMKDEPAYPIESYVGTL